ncbi:hypothetical protein BDZ89DRAFT_1162711 [Hymenopellis radicata]|nr:hypothetical protein BDZ89DRAFT_1162711 [Hymenopellis radicata]
MQQIASQCTNCGAFTRRSFHHEEEYQSSVLLERLRTSNLPATDEEISHIRHTILPTVTDDISSIESKLASLREVITSMEEERERLKNVQKRYSNLVSLHRTLPSEIWSEVFLYAVCIYSNAFNASRPMWQLSHVCQRWRNVSLSIPSFWSNIEIDFRDAAQKEANVQLLETVIQRSRQGPLNVYLISGYSSVPSPDPSILKRILDIILAESHRWRKLHLTDDSGCWNMLYAALHNRLPRLESLALYVPQLELEKHSAVSVFENCPRLTKLSLGGVVKLPWDQITELDLSPMGPVDSEEERRECIRLIGRCPSLETLSMPEWGSEDDESVYTAITCSNMRKLDATSVPVINALTLPCLREVFFRPEPATADYALSSFKQLLIRSNCITALTSLSLANVPLAASPADCTLHSILSQTHSLAILGSIAVLRVEF